MTEQDFKLLYIEEYTIFIQSFFPKLQLVKKNYPHFLMEQIGNYESLIINEADNIVLETVIKHNINLSDIFGEGFQPTFLLNKLVLKCWSVQKSTRETVFDNFISDILLKKEDD